MRTTRSNSLFSLNHLCSGLAADRGLHDGLDVGNVDAVARDFCAIGLDKEARLTEFAHDREFGEAGRFVEDVLDFHGFFLEHVESRAEDFHRQGRS